MKRRDLFKFLFGLGLGVVAAETYERLYSIPALEKAFRKEIEYWLGQYLDAKRKTEELSSKLKTKEEEIDALQKDVSYWKSQYNSIQDEVNKLNTKVGELSSKLNEANEKIYSLEEELDDWKSKYESTKEEANRLKSIIGSMDELERESVYVISYYREKMNEAVDNLKRAIEKYRVILGDDRVAFESSTVKILEDLKLTQEKLQKVLPYFPLILNFAWKPTKVINDKIYDINVSFEVASPLSSLEEVEVMLIPVEYRYFITKYGMREEDYDKVFPKEEIRSVKIEPKKLEEEMFSVDFEDLKGGREYIVKARVKDVAGNEKTVEIKTPYIRQFENIAKADDIIVAVPYYLWYRRDLSNWKDGHKYMPLLGEYRSDDPIVMSKHIDWATGYGIGVFLISWSGYESGDLKYFDENLNLLLKNPLSKDIKFGILYESIGRLKNSNPGWNLSDPENIEILDNDFSYLSKNYFNHPSCFRMDGKPLIYFYEGKGVFGNISQIKNLREKYGIFLVSDHGHPKANPTDVFPTSHPQAVVWGEAAKMFNGITSWLGGYDPNGNYLGGNYENQIKIGFSKWESWAIENERKFIPSITPEFDSRYVKWGNPNSIPLYRSPELFIERLKIALNHIKNSKLLMIGTWNDFFESTTLEPSREYGFTYLELIKSNK